MATVRPLTARDILEWLTEGVLSQQLWFTGRIPHRGDSSGVAQFLADFQEGMIRSCSRPAMLSGFWEFRNAMAPCRPACELPHAGTEKMLPSSGATIIDVAASRAFELRAGNDTQHLALAAGGKLYEFPVAAEPILRYLSQSKTVTVETLVNHLSGDYGGEDIRSLIADLLSEGLILCR